jgi:murein DD-endopeptidase MepM/ murein hydrolase activator NlpD
MRALTGGFQDENDLTNLIFFARHPGLRGRKLTASDPQSLKDEWMSILKTIVRPAIRRMREAGAKPSAGSNSAPFAEPPKTGYYPLVTQRKEGMIVSYREKDGTIVGREGLMFMAKRSSKGGGLRYHVGIDLPAYKGDRVVSCEDGRIVAFRPFVFAGKSFASRDTSKPYTCALLVQHPSENPRIVVNYGEVAPDSLSRLGLRAGSNGSKVEAGQPIAFIGECPEGSSMLHFETYTSGTKSTAKWPQGQPRPNNILLITCFYFREMDYAARLRNVSR